jgi:hypothetical protein
MEVTIYTPAFIALENAEVTVNYTVTNGIVTFPKFYIVNRIIKGETVKLTCRCAMHRLDRPFPVSGLLFDDNSETSTNDVITRIASQIGLSASFPFLSVLPKLSEKFLRSNNCLLILEKLSEAFAGYWRIHNGLLVFIPFEQVFTSSVSVSEHDPIETGLIKQISRVVMTGGGETFDYGAGDFTQTVCIDTELASAEIAANVYSRLLGYSYVTLMKTMCKAFVFPGVTCEVTFENSQNVFGHTFRINSLKAYPRRSGFYLELSNNAVREDEWDYSGKTEREIKRLNQLFSELEEGGDEPEPEPQPITDTEPWKRDSDWALFEAMPHENGETYLGNSRQMNIMVKVISETRTVKVYGAYAGAELTGSFSVDWGDGTPIESPDGTLLTNTSSGSLIPDYTKKILTTHTYAANGVYYVRITTIGNHGSAIILPRDRFSKNPPLIIGYKLNWGSMNLLIQARVSGNDYGSPYADDVTMSCGDLGVFFRSKFFQINGASTSHTGSFKAYTMLYNPYWFDFIQHNYTGITTAEDLEI